LPFRERTKLTLADKGYDANGILGNLADRKMEVVIPGRCSDPADLGGGHSRLLTECIFSGRIWLVEEWSVMP
jgi:hypothetical protein